MVQFASLMSGLVVASLVSPAEWGNWYLLNLIIVYGMLTQLGALNGMNREVPAALGQGRSDEAVDLRRATLAVLVSSIAVSSAALLAFGALLPGVGLTDVFVLTIVLLFANQVYGYVTTSLRSTTSFTELSRLQVLRAVVYPVLAIGGAALLQVPGFILGQAVALLFAALVGTGTGTVAWRPKFDFNLARRLIRVGFPIMLVGFVHSLFATVDRWVVAGFRGSEALGHYSLAIMALGAVALVPLVISQQFYPRMAFAWSANQDAEELRRLADRQRLLSFTVVLPVVVLLVLVAPPVVRALLPQYAAGIPALVVTLLIPLVSTVGEGFGNVLNVLDRQSWYLAAIIAAVVVNLGVSIALIEPLGIVGVAIGTSVAFAVLSLLRVLLGGAAIRQATAERTRAA